MRAPEQHPQAQKLLQERTLQYTMAASPISLRGHAAPWAALCCALLFSAAVLAEAAPTLAAAIIAPAPAPLLGVPAPAPAPKVLTLHEKVVAALRAAGHYGAISGLLDSLGDSTIIKPGITLFAPDDGAFDGLNMNSSLLLTTTLDYHVSTTVYTYQQLSTLPLNSTIQTAAPNVEIIVTSTGTNGFRLDDVAISDPDLYSDGQVAVQGVSSVFNTAKYNKGVVPPEAAPAPLAGEAPGAAPPGYITTPTGPKPAGSNSTKSDAARVVTTILGTMILASSVSVAVSLL
ncbi:hypothetical protein KC19_4G016800 [Ceratodon purpureus]|uniref:FAS1 domain-containing protein n=1 Tax=Ceratodon purpureus TaxID=3225 RepID=A0A8T0I5S1_CERPU|nr:hypothetical protein KC19_N040400 [Ceratodon purpureus]KAG0578359.1 hypothetical protein KC19_4G016800 [Ceratodon purpureus]